MLVNSVHADCMEGVDGRQQLHADYMEALTGVNSFVQTA